ncbi:NAD(P)-dependent oxidoreductase [Streptomyces sp. G44]|uniref:NAD-dependent epimerase/dehydratase family protein n=1 Tax=Streptomyces sp. G44 TaxID=2807632 RepID=UPI00196212FA|nr:NAD(P)-dependent oxidoreductase [Streptomyces sp. G44]MBM7170757.1 NAD(P)-dependent oxidoreductase [Streptomyces sp. G44]
MRILLLGSTGYLGGHVAERLRALPGVRLLRGGRAPDDDHRIDLAGITTDALAEQLSKAAPDAVVNCAGTVSGTTLNLAEVNSRGPAVLCEALRAAAPDARLVHLGSAAEYGPRGAGERTPEDTPARPVTPYGATKLAGTLAVLEARIDALVLRVTEPVGPGAPPAGLPGRLTAELSRAVARSPHGTLRAGDLSAYRDFVDVRDVAQAVALALALPGRLPRLLNIGSGRAAPARDLAHGLADAAGFTGDIEETPGAADRPTAVPWQCSDITAAEWELGWRPRFTLRESLAALWASDGAPLLAPATGDPA